MSKGSYVKAHTVIRYFNKRCVSEPSCGYLYRTFRVKRKKAVLYRIFNEGLNSKGKNPEFLCFKVELYIDPVIESRSFKL